VAIDPDLKSLAGSKAKWDESGRGYLMYKGTNNCLKQFKKESGFPKACGLRKNNKGGKIEVIEILAPGSGISEQTIKSTFRFK